ncbi:MAG: glycosyltransferase family 4 protein [Lachnospiraceae bacterium]|nr:glycosyltransferase family 4 protein [Lachnospiraceae bacterium]
MRDGRDKKKILYLMEYPIDLPGGGQESTKTLCEGVKERGDYTPVIACPELLHASISGYPYTVITYPSDENRELSRVRRLTNFFGRIRWFYKIIRQTRPDLIHVSMSESLITFGALRVLGFFSDIPFVYTDRGLCFGYRKHSKMCIRATMKHARYMITTTEFNARLWKREISTPIRVIPNTISNAFADYDPEGRIKARQEYGVGDVPVIGFAGRISEEKDWGSVPSVVKAIADAGIKFKVALVMSVYEDRDEAIAASVRDGIAKVIGRDNLIYMQDLSQKEISRYYYLVDFFIMTSCFESFGKAAVEAMSRKCIVLSTAVGGLGEVIGSKDDLYDIKRPEKLAKRIKYLLEHPDEEAAEREMFYSRYKDNYTIDKNVEGHIRLYKEILG